ncbi:unnamed protein product [Moneuplotes crassus]|uniref:Uncharacterized protein n=1 Tax=Euplotes crassus TaxID=5936 RepID=A0AAD1Y3K0_EUPCR|nr:unnamed protein product [Moneuplotes crassus]
MCQSSFDCSLIEHCCSANAEGLTNQGNMCVSMITGCPTDHPEWTIGPLLPLVLLVIFICFLVIFKVLENQTDQQQVSFTTKLSAEEVQGRAEQVSNSSTAREISTNPATKLDKSCVHPEFNLDEEEKAFLRDPLIPDKV